MYVAGLRPESILSPRKDEGLLLFEGKSVKIDRVDSWHHQKETTLSLTRDGVAFLKRHELSFVHISQFKKNSDYVFSPEKSFGHPLSLDIFERELSKAVKRHSRKLGSEFAPSTLRRSSV